MQKANVSAFIVLSLTCFVSVLSGCTGEPGRHYNSKNGFSIELPGAWETQEGGGMMGIAVISKSPQEGSSDMFQENVNVVVEAVPKGITASEYFEQSSAQYAKMLTNFSVDENTAATIDGTEVKRLVFSHQMGEMKFKVLSYILTKGAKAYVITCTASPATFDSYKGTFEKVSQSFRFE
ncbi:MAG: DcrB-related protein [Planctomycetota bacterium]|jgi:hypothetical protein